MCEGVDGGDRKMTIGIIRNVKAFKNVQVSLTPDLGTNNFTFSHFQSSGENYVVHIIHLLIGTMKTASLTLILYFKQ